MREVIKGLSMSIKLSVRHPTFAKKISTNHLEAETALFGLIMAKATAI